MILIFCFQSNKHWHENEPQAETSNEKMKLVFQLTDQKHFIHYNQAFIWRDLFCVWVCARVCVCMCVHEVDGWGGRSECAHVNTLFMLLFVLCFCLLLLHWHAAHDIFQPFVPNLAACLSVCNFMPHLSLLHPSQSTTDKLRWSSNQLHLALLLRGGRDDRFNNRPNSNTSWHTTSYEQNKVDK